MIKQFITMVALTGVILGLVLASVGCTTDGSGSSVRHDHGVGDKEHRNISE